MHPVGICHIIYHVGNDVWQVSACSRGVVQMAGEVEGLEEPSVRCRRGGGGGGQVGRELRRLRQRVRKTLDDWLDYYKAALGIELQTQVLIKQYVYCVLKLH